MAAPRRIFEGPPRAPLRAAARRIARLRPSMAIACHVDPAGVSDPTDPTTLTAVIPHDVPALRIAEDPAGFANAILRRPSAPDPTAARRLGADLADFRAARASAETRRRDAA